MKKKIAAFDFDGTITRHDTFIMFIKFACGNIPFYLGFTLLSPALVLWKIKILKNSQVKQLVFSWFFKNMKIDKFNALCSEFSTLVTDDVRKLALKAINDYMKEGYDVVIISASIENWILPWAKKVGIHNILSTQIETAENGYLTGCFKSENCHGEEKVARLVNAYSITNENRDNFEIVAYGDSNGDTALLSFANHGYLNKF